MSEPWYPGATQNPGVCAHYERGRTPVQCVKAHYTVGRDSTGIGLQGYFQFLVARDGTVTQFAPVDALCWDSGEWNGMGPGIEVEYLDEPSIFTAEARVSCGVLVRWLSAEWGVPLSYYDGDRIGRESGYRGFISHRSLIQTEEHQDYWPQTDWAAMTQVGPVPPVPTEEDDDMGYWMRSVETSQDLYVSEFRVSGYPINSWSGPVVTATKAEVDAEIQARAALAAKIKFPLVGVSV